MNPSLLTEGFPRSALGGWLAPFTPTNSAGIAVGTGTLQGRGTYKLLPETSFDSTQISP